MPLTINDLVYDENKFDHLYDAYPTLKETCQNRFSYKLVRLINSPKFVFVSQGEYCIVNRADDSVDLIGSDEATTCCLLFFQTSTSIAVAHLDNSVRLESLQTIIDEVLNNGNQSKCSTQSSTENSRITCSIIGSYNDERKYSYEFIGKFLKLLNQIPNVTIVLKLACILEMNTKIVYKDGKEYNNPIFLGAAVDLTWKRHPENGRTDYDFEPFPAEFKDRGPDIILRKVGHLFRNKDMVRVYNSIDRLFVIEKFNYNEINNLELLINAPDQFILDNFSTSPHAEPEHFVESMRKMFSMISLSRSQEPSHRYKREREGWIEIL